jgi:hypothetical protein
MFDFETYTVANCLVADTEARRAFAEKLLSRQRYHKVPLLLETKARPFENLESILFQAARNNGMTSVTPLLRALDLPQRGVLNPKRHAQLGGSMKVGSDRLATAVPTAPSAILPKGSVIYSGHCLRRDQLALSTSRICPACVRETGYGHAWWTLAPLAFCDVHGAALIDHCPNCASPISIARPAYDICSCGAKLLDHPSESPNRAAQAVAQLIAARFKREPDPEGLDELGFPVRHLRPLGLSAMLDLVTFFGTLSQTPGTVRMRKLKGVVRLDYAAIGHERAARILAGWPGNFYAELRCARAFVPNSDTQPLVAKSLDHIVQLATGSLRQPELQFVVAEIACFLASPDEWSEQRRRAACQRRGFDA